MAERLDALGNVVTREASTEALYAVRVAMLTRRLSEQIEAAADLFDVIDAFSGSDEAYAPSTIRQYTAALAWAVDAAEATGSLDAGQITACRERLSHRPAPRPRSAPSRTSAKKRRSVPKGELHAVCKALRTRNRPDDRLLLRILVNNVVFGLRPREYDGAEVCGEHLVVPNAKNTNGRGLADTRELELVTLSRAQVASVHALIEDIEKAARGNLAALIDRLGARLRRICRTLGIAPICLYTTRHQAIANRKKTGTTEEVAAFAGHASVHTARKHYAPRGAAWTLTSAVKPSPAMVDAVIARRDISRNLKSGPKM